MKNQPLLPKVDQQSLKNFVVAQEFVERGAASTQEAVRDILLNLGEDPEREGLIKTPDRVARMFDEITVGYRTDFLPNWRDLLALNPLTGVVDGFRWCLLGGGMDFYPPGLVVSLAMAALLLGTGLWYFRATERQFADVI